MPYMTPGAAISMAAYIHRDTDPLYLVALGFRRCRPSDDAMHCTMLGPNIQWEGQMDYDNGRCQPNMCVPCRWEKTDGRLLGRFGLLVIFWKITQSYRCDEGSAAGASGWPCFSLLSGFYNGKWKLYGRIEGWSLFLPVGAIFDFVFVFEDFPNVLNSSIHVYVTVQ